MDILRYLKYVFEPYRMLQWLSLKWLENPTYPWSSIYRYPLNTLWYIYQACKKSPEEPLHKDTWPLIPFVGGMRGSGGFLLSQKDHPLTPHERSSDVGKYFIHALTYPLHHREIWPSVVISDYLTGNLTMSHDIRWDIPIFKESFFEYSIKHRVLVYKGVKDGIMMGVTDMGDMRGGAMLLTSDIFLVPHLMDAIRQRDLHKAFKYLYHLGQHVLSKCLPFYGEYVSIVDMFRIGSHKFASIEFDRGDER